MNIWQARRSRRSSGRSSVVALGWHWLAAILLTAAPAVAQSPLEAAVKAAYLYKFLSYVEWPPITSRPPASAPHEDATLTVGVVGSDTLLAELQKVIAGRRVNDRPVVAKKVAAGESLDGLDALYVGRTAVAAGMLSALKGRPVLVVTDEPDGLPAGAALNFLLVDGRVRFEAALAGTERGGLRLSARLLAVAERVVAP